MADITSLLRKVQTAVAQREAEVREQSRIENTDALREALLVIGLDVDTTAPVMFKSSSANVEITLAKAVEVAKSNDGAVFVFAFALIRDDGLSERLDYQVSEEQLKRDHLLEQVKLVNAIDALLAR